MALRPTRDMSAFLSLPDVADDLAPHALLGGGPAGHQAAGGGEDVDAQASIDPRDALHAGTVLEVDAQDALLAVLVDLEVRHVSLVLQDPRDFDLQLRRGDVHAG